MAEVLSPIRPSANDHVSTISVRDPSPSDYSTGMSSSPSRHVNYTPNQQTHGGHHPPSYRPSAPVAPYTFRTTPQIRTQPLSSDGTSSGNRLRYPAPSSASTTSSSSSSPPSLPPLSKDDALLFTDFQMPELDLSRGNEEPVQDDAEKSKLQRYRRLNKFSDVAHSNNTKASVFNGVTASGAFGGGRLAQFQYTPDQFAINTSPKLEPTIPPPGDAVDTPIDTPIDTPFDSPWDSHTPVATPIGEKTEIPRRYRRRSSLGNTIENRQLPTPAASTEASPASPSTTPTSPLQDMRPAGAPYRAPTPSPLSRPVSGGAGNPSAPQSAAAAAMAALNAQDRDPNKGVKSRLRRAFSFGSTVELRRAAENEAVAERIRARQDQFGSELDEEQNAIARKQEAAGLGNSIYTGQGGVFAGSTDNLSISSTASSASLMLRKMGRGVKKGSKSIKGLFRPKSVIGVPAADAPGEASVGQVSIVNIEAEREQINVNANPHDKTGGGTGFPRLEKNSLETGRLSLSEADPTTMQPRPTVTGSEQERQEVLAAVKRGILKRTPSPSVRPFDGSFDQPSPAGSVHVERRNSPAPSNASSERRRTGHRRTDSHAIEGDDYFEGGPRLLGNQSPRSMPGTPRSIARNISFSPRIHFHDAWSSSEYDRRGDIATCNRLTPLLAQQIKEELNTFKMEMEVHELSKPHTHFF